MRLKSITGKAAGRAYAIALTAPVTLLVGPTGAGKTTLLRLAEWGAAGRLRGDDGAPVTTARHIHQRLGAELGSVEAQVTIETNGGILRVERTIDATEREGKVSCSSTVIAARPPWAAKGAAATAEIERLLGSPVVLDAVMARTAVDARRGLIDACARHAPPWSQDQVVDELKREIVRVIDARWPDSPERPVPTSVLAAACAGSGMPAAPTILDAALAAAERTHDRLKAIAADLKAARSAAEQSEDVAQAVAQPTPDEIRSLREEVAGLEAELEELSVERAAAVERASSVAALARRVADLRSVESCEVAERHLELDRAALVAAVERLAEAERRPAPPAVEDLDQHQEQDELEILESDLKVASDASALAKARADAVTRAIEASETHAAACPTCLQTIGAEHADALRSERSVLDQRVSRLRREREAIQSDVNEVRLAIAKAQSAHAAKVEAARIAADRIRQDIAQARLEVESLSARLPRSEDAVRAAQRAASDLDAARCALEAAQADDVLPAIDARIASARARRADLVREIEASARLDERAAAADRSREVVEELEDGHRALRAAHEAWQGVIASLGRASIEPLIATIGPLLPAGWTVRVDLSTVEIYIDRPGVPAATMAQLSRGERGILAAAATAALAALTVERGGGWRMVVADHAETLASEGPTDDGEGYLVALARRMSEAVGRGDVDQVLIATARLTSTERASLEGLGVQVVDVQPGVDAGEPQGKPKRGRRAA